MKTSASPASQQQIQPAPSITSDPRYRAARRLISSGRSADGAIEMLATLVEEARSKYGEDSVEAAAVYYEYGNSLFRAVEKRKDDEKVIMRDASTAKANEKRGMTDEELALELMENAFAIYDQYYDEAVEKDGNEKKDGVSLKQLRKSKACIA